jgi:hypothetical protein
MLISESKDPALSVAEKRAYVIERVELDPRMIHIACNALAWEYLYESTRDREEQIRQLRAEIAQLIFIDLDEHEMKDWILSLGGRNETEIVEAIQTHYRDCRTRSRLEAQLADLQRGMKVQP